MIIKTIEKLILSEATPGILIFLAATCSMILANSDIGQQYMGMLNAELFGSHYSILHTVNDFLMVIFFFTVAIEIKREIIIGKLSSVSSVVSPIIAAILGMIVPALIFFMFNQDAQDPNIMNGWAIPTATDIAFSIAVLNLVGKAVPKELKLFLLSLAIIDDLGAIIIIALFYSKSIDINSLLIVVGLLLVLVVFNYYKVKFLSLYYIVGIIAVYFTSISGIHTTIVGVLIGLTIPLGVSTRKNKEKASYYNHHNSPLIKAEEFWFIPVSFIILPIFAAVNSTLVVDFSVEFSTITNGVMYGLTLGKLIGVFGLLLLITKMGKSNFPEGTGICALIGLSLLTGVGFTMSLFINNLSYPNDIQYLNEAKLGVFVGSILSAVLGYILLKVSYLKK